MKKVHVKLFETVKKILNPFSFIKVHNKSFTFNSQKFKS